MTLFERLFMSKNQSQKESDKIQMEYNEQINPDAIDEQDSANQGKTEIPEDATQLKLQAELEEKTKLTASLETERNDFKDRYIRKMAEFDNFKRRTEQEQQLMLKYSGEKFILKLLPVVDDFERSLQHITEKSDVKGLQEGVQLIYEKFIKFLSDNEVKKIETIGKEFDVNLHDALYPQPTAEIPPNTILQEVQAGYTYKEKVIRHSQVIVSAEPPEVVAQAEEKEEGK